jgi:hypothetical protein
MLQLDTNKKRILEYKIDIQGIDYKELEGVLKFTIENVHYGFPLEILSDNILAEVPPLETIVKNLKDKDIIKCKLEVYGEGFYLNPWSGEFQLAKPVKVEAALKGEDEIEGKAVTATLVEKTNRPKEDIKPENIDESEKKKVLTKLFKKIEAAPKKKLISEKVQSKLTEMNNLVDMFTSSSLRNIKNIPKPVKPKKIMVENDPLALMASFGMKNKNIQERLLESIGDNEPDEVCRQLRKMLGNENQDSISLYSKLRG